MKVLLFLSLLAAPVLCLAQVNKCIDTEGKLTFTDMPCPAKSVEMPEPKADPLARRADAARTAPSSSSQAQRDVRTAFIQYHRAVQQLNWNEYLQLVPTERRAKMEGFGKGALAALNAIQPKEVEVVDTVINGDAATLKAKGKSPTMVAGANAESHGTIRMLKENGVWKVDAPGWSNQAWGSVAAPDIQVARKSTCQGIPGKPESLPDHPALKAGAGEAVVSRVSLDSGSTSEVSFAVKHRQRVSFRVAFNEALRCQYAEPPAAMSIDGGKQWLHAYASGYTLDPVNGRIAVILKNTAQETLSLVVVTSGVGL